MHGRAVEPEGEHVVNTVAKGVRVRGILASVAAGLVGVLLAAAPAVAAAVNINDASHVLDVTRVQNEAATLPDPVEIYTTTKFADDKAAFDRETQSKAAAATIIVIAINTQSHHLAIRTGSRSRVTQNAAQAATQAFTNTFRGASDYTAATIAALQSMRTAIGSAGAPGKATKPAQQSGVPNYVSNLLCLLLVGVVVALIVAAVRRSRSRARRAVGDDPGGYGPPGYGPSGNGPSGNGPSGYGPSGYGPPPGSGSSGINPWVAGGVGAVAGGVLGYGLGHMGSEREDHRPEAHDGHANNDTGSGGGGADGDFGGDGGSGDTF
jgi:hypothetical protein